MGDAVGPRKAFISEQAEHLNIGDLDIWTTKNDYWNSEKLN